MKKLLILLLAVLFATMLVSCNEDEKGEGSSSSEVVDCSRGAHDYDPVSLLLPTCTNDGIIRFVCSACQDYYDAPTDKLGHNYKETQIRAPECEQNGITRYGCTRCEYFYDVPIGAIGHDYKLVSREEYCWRKGTLVEKCANCEDEKTTELDRIAHKEENGVCADCGAGYNPNILFVTNVTGQNPTPVESALMGYSYTVTRHLASEAIPTSEKYEIIIFDAGVAPMSIPDNTDAVWYLGATTAPTGSGIVLGDTKTVPSGEKVYLSEGEEDTLISQFILNRVNVTDEQIGEYIEVTDAGSYEGIIFAQGSPIMLIGKSGSTTVFLTTFNFNMTTLPMSVVDFVYLIGNMVNAPFANK